MQKKIPEGTIRVTLDLVPHDMENIQARRFPHPDVRRLLLPEWWNLALFGPRAGRDPMPRIVQVNVRKEIRMELEEGGRESRPDPVEGDEE